MSWADKKNQTKNSQQQKILKKKKLGKEKKIQWKMMLMAFDRFNEQYVD